MVYVHDSSGDIVFRRFYDHFGAVIHQFVLELLIHLLNRNNASYHWATRIVPSNISSILKHGC